MRGRKMFRWAEAHRGGKKIEVVIFRNISSHMLNLIKTKILIVFCSIKSTAWLIRQSYRRLHMRTRYAIIMTSIRSRFLPMGFGPALMISSTALGQTKGRIHVKTIIGELLCSTRNPIKIHSTRARRANINILFNLVWNTFKKLNKWCANAGG